MEKVENIIPSLILSQRRVAFMENYLEGMDALNIFLGSGFASV